MALYSIGHHNDATDAFDTMLLKMSESSDPDIRGEDDHVMWICSDLMPFRRTILPLCPAGKDEGNDPCNYQGCDS